MIELSKNKVLLFFQSLRADVTGLVDVLNVTPAFSRTELTSKTAEPGAKPARSPNLFEIAVAVLVLVLADVPPVEVSVEVFLEGDVLVPDERLSRRTTSFSYLAVISASLDSRSSILLCMLTVLTTLVDLSISANAMNFAW